MIAKTLYITGSLTLEEYEAAVEHVLKGGTLTRQGLVPEDGKIIFNRDMNPFREPLMEGVLTDG